MLFMTCRGNDASERLLQGFIEMRQPTALSQLSAQFRAVLVLDYYNSLFPEVRGSQVAVDIQVDLNTAEPLPPPFAG
jgi:hypothetical protein